MSISEKRIIDHDEPLSTREPPEHCSARLEAGANRRHFAVDCTARATWRRVYVGGETAYFCDQHVDDGIGPLELVVKTYEGPAPSARELALAEREERIRKIAGGYALLRYQARIAREIRALADAEYTAGADYGLGVAAQLAEALTIVRSLILDEDKITPPARMNEMDRAAYLRQKIAPALAAYRAVIGESS